jgi:hypothetical protein
MIKSQIMPKFVVDMKKIEPKNISEKKVFENTKPKPKPKSIKSKGK